MALKIDSHGVNVFPAVEQVDANPIEDGGYEVILVTRIEGELKPVIIRLLQTPDIRRRGVASSPDERSEIRDSRPEVTDPWRTPSTVSRCCLTLAEAVEPCDVVGQVENCPAGHEDVRPRREVGHVTNRSHHSIRYSTAGWSDHA